MYKLTKAETFWNHPILVYSLAISSILAIAKIEAQEDVQVKSAISRLLVMTVASDPNNEAFQRFNRSVEAYELDLTVLFPPATSTSNRQEGEEATSKIDLVRKALAVHKNEQGLAVLLVDSQNLILNGDKNDILARFSKFDSKTKILFSADSRCLPNPELAPQYPKAPSGGDRFLNSDALIGFAPALWELFNLSNEIEQKQQDNKDFQSYCTQAYLDANIRQKLAIELDHKAELFQNLHSLESDVEVELNLDSVKLKNRAYSSEPVVVHGDGPSRLVLNSLGNYLGKAWTLNDGCRHCNETMISLASLKESELPTVLIGVFIEEATPFLEYFFLSLKKLDYPKNKIHLFIHNTIQFHDKELNSFINDQGSQYASQQVVKDYKIAAEMPEWKARNYALELCKRFSCDYYLSLDSTARLEYSKSLRVLIESNRTIIAPLLTRPGKLWSNFWGSLTPDGYYARSHDYINLIKGERLGIWNVPHVMNAYLINGKFIKHCLEGEESKISPKLTYHDPLLPLKPTLAFTHFLRDSNVFQYVTNTHEFGHLVDPTTYNTSLTHPDFYQLKENMEDWEERYLHENYTHIFEEENHIEKPCPDVSWFPLVNEVFCQHLIDIMETFGKWSGGTNDDPRIEGGYESVPTRDIHMKQVGLHELWMSFVQEYVMPVQLKEYIGYEHDPPHAELAFVVRYHPAEQAFLRPHHDSSTYTLNVALNTPHVDYEGGGCRFLRYNCSVTESRRGWALIHPGRLTHYHEGLPVTNGTRYILVTFVDP